MQNNPYESPAAPADSSAAFPTLARAGDCAFVGSVWGGTIGAACGAATAIGLLGWFVVVSDHQASADDVGELAMVEQLISMAIMRITLHALVGALAGLPLGAALGLLAGKCRFRNPRSLTAIASSLAAATAALCAGLAWFVCYFMNSYRDPSSWVVLLIVAIAAGGMGGVVLGQKLSGLFSNRTAIEP